MIIWVILGPLQNHLRSTDIDHLALPVIPYAILENDLKIHVFLAAVESEVASAVESVVTAAAALVAAVAVEVAVAVASRFEDPAQSSNIDAFIPESLNIQNHRVYC